MVVKEFYQQKGIDFNEIFSPLIKIQTICIVLGMAAILDLELEQLDVKTAFLHGDVEEDLYMEKPEGFVKLGHENLYCKLKPSLNGIKKASRLWYRKFYIFMVEHNFIRCDYDPCLYFKWLANGNFVILLLYGDDMLVTGSNMRVVKELKQHLAQRFAMKELEAAKRSLGMTII